ncbi:efflux transporter outer membrane subunit [Pandoraea sputorum]|nr:efflux transporter outer membrane subunit [Pandoraea sputorum]
MQASRSPFDLQTLQAGEHISEAYRASGIGSASTAKPGATAWWDAFGDEQLTSLMTLAAESAPSIQIAQARLKQAEAAWGTATANLYPSVDGTVSATANRFPNHYTFPSPYAGNYGSQGTLGGSAQYHLDFWGKWRDAASAAEWRAQAAEYEAADARLLLQTSLAAAYLRLDATYRLRDVAEQGLSRRNGMVAVLAQRQRAGLETDIGLVASEEAASLTRAEIAHYDAQIAGHRHMIAALLGQSPSFADTLSRPRVQSADDPAPVSNLPAVLLGYRPDVAARRSAAEAAAKDIGVARAAFYPDVDLSAFAGLQSLGLGYLLRAGSTSAQIGPAITLPIFEGGRLRANLKGRVAEYDAAVSAYDTAVVNALQQVADSIATLKAARIRQETARGTHRHWVRVVDLHRLRQQSGLSDTRDFLSAETALLLSVRREAEASADVADAQIALIRALGGAWSPASSSQTFTTSHKKS